MNSRLEVLTLLSEYPHLIPSNNLTKWEGYISIKNHQFKARINVPNYPSLAGVSWEFHPQIEKILLIQKSELIKSKSLINFLHKLQQIIQNIFSKKTSYLFENNLSIWNEQRILLFKQMLDDLQKSVQSCNVEEIGCDMKWVRVCYRDSKCSTHSVTLGLEDSYEQQSSFSIIQHDLPTEAVSILSQTSSFNHFFTKFEEIIESLIPFWDMCKNLEEKTWVIEPEHPKRGDLYRRIYLAEDLSVTLKFNPFDITSLPDVKFLGAINAVNQAREKFQSSLEIYDGWDNDLTLLENLERLLDVKQFVNKKYIDNMRLKIGNSGDCLICYSILSEQPVKYCLNKKCSALFHLSCLLKWFETSQTSAAGPSYDYVRGPCPCCETLMYCPRNAISLE